MNQALDTGLGGNEYTKIPKIGEKVLHTLRFAHINLLLVMADCILPYVTMLMLGLKFTVSKKTTKFETISHIN